MEQETTQNDANVTDETVSTGTETVPATQTSQTEEEFEFTWNKRPVKTTREKLLNYASQGYDYAQQMNRLKAERAQFEQTYAPYKQIDDYVKQNPDWWKHVQSQWESRGQQQQQQAQSANGFQLPPELQQQIAELTKFRDEIMTQREQERIAKEDAAVNEEITSIKKQYANFDWNSLDDNGFDLTYRVLKYGAENNLPSFRAAFRDMMHDDIVRHASLQNAEKAAKETQAQTKQGIVSRSPQPRSAAPTTPKDIRNRSYDDLAEDIKREMRSK